MLAGRIAAVLHWAGDVIDPPRPVTDEDVRRIGSTVWTDTDCSLFHGYADDVED